MRYVFAILAVRSRVPEQRASRQTTINRIIDEELNHSELPQTAAYLTDRIGGRMTNSPADARGRAMDATAVSRPGASRTCAPKASTSAAAGRSSASRARMVTPRVLVDAGHPRRVDAVDERAPSARRSIVAPMQRERDFDKWKGKLRGKIVLVDQPGDGSEPDAGAVPAPVGRGLRQARQVPAADALGDRDRTRRSNARRSPRSSTRSSRRGRARVAAAVVSRRRVWCTARATRTAWARRRAVPGIELAAEDYRRLARLAKTDAAPTVELTSVVRYDDDDHNAYNIIAEIPGRDPKAGYVMAGAHLTAGSRPTARTTTARAPWW